jgi:hypothetical protein
MMTLPKIDADPILDPMISWQRRVASGHVLLNDDAAAHRFDGTIEYRDEAIAGRFDESSVMFRDAGLNEVALDSLDAYMRAFFIEFHETAVAGDIARDDRGETTSRHPARWHIVFPASLDGVYIVNFLARERQRKQTMSHVGPSLTLRSVFGCKSVVASSIQS